MNSTFLSKPIEVTKADPCPICGKPDWCCWLPDGAAVCGRVDIPPQGWIKAAKSAKDGRNIFQPIRNRAVPRPNRTLPVWRRTGRHDGKEFEKEIIFQYSDTQRVVRRQWSDRREAYEVKRRNEGTGKFKSKVVIPQYKQDDDWLWGRGSSLWPLYRIDDIKATDVLFYVGGEICVETLRKWGFSATCHQGGEGTYIDEIIESLRSKRFLMLVIIPDNDKAGRKAADRLLEASLTQGLVAAILDPLDLNPKAAEKWDVADWDVSKDDAQSKITASVSLLTPEKSEYEGVEGLKLMTSAYALEQDAFARAILEREISSKFGVRGARLEELERIAVKPSGMGNTLLAESLVSIFDEIEERATGGALQGVLSGFLDLDGMTQGYQPGDLIIFGARPSQGKTSAALAHAMEAAKNGHSTYFFSLEMSKSQLNYRMLSTLSGIESGRLRSGRIASQEWETLGHAVAALSALPLIVNDTPQMTVAEIREALIGGVYAPAIVFIDYLQLIEGPGLNDASKYGAISRKLKGLARELKIPVVALSQLNRSVESRTNKRPVMSDLRESGGLEQDADVIIMLYREDYYDPETPDRGIAELNIVKHRNGPTGTVKVLFEPKFTRFRDLAHV